MLWLRRCVRRLTDRGCVSPSPMVRSDPCRVLDVCESNKFAFCRVGCRLSSCFLCSRGRHCACIVGVRHTASSHRIMRRLARRSVRRRLCRSGVSNRGPRVVRVILHPSFLVILLAGARDRTSRAQLALLALSDACYAAAVVPQRGVMTSGGFVGPSFTVTFAAALDSSAPTRVRAYTLTVPLPFSPARRIGGSHALPAPAAEPQLSVRFDLALPAAEQAGDIVSLGASQSLFVATTRGSTLLAWSGTSGRLMGVLDRAPLAHVPAAATPVLLLPKGVSQWTRVDLSYAGDRIATTSPSHAVVLFERSLSF